MILEEIFRNVNFVEFRELSRALLEKIQKLVLGTLFTKFWLWGRNLKNKWFEKNRARFFAGYRKSKSRETEWEPPPDMFGHLKESVFFDVALLRSWLSRNFSSDFLQIFKKTCTYLSISNHTVSTLAYGVYGHEKCTTVSALTMRSVWYRYH